MKYLYAPEYATLYYLNKDKVLCGIPELGFDRGIGTFNTTEWFAIELDNDEMPKGFYASVIERLSEKTYE